MNCHKTDLIYGDPCQFYTNDVTIHCQLTPTEEAANGSTVPDSHGGKTRKPSRRNESGRSFQLCRIMVTRVHCSLGAHRATLHSTSRIQIQAPNATVQRLPSQ
jgi:hypothetical protein